MMCIDMYSLLFRNLIECSIAVQESGPISTRLVHCGEVPEARYPFGTPQYLQKFYDNRRFVTTEVRKDAES